MRSPILATLLAPLLLVPTVACSGGSEPVVVDGFGPTPDQVQTPDQNRGSTSPFDIPAGLPAPSSPIGEPCNSCNDALEQGIGEPLCAFAQNALNSLFACACGPACSAECSFECLGQVGGGLTANCETCLLNSCNAEYTVCVNN
ncbi:MAG: hypothetical protein AAGA56_16320 [Myxococcota bacterium]